MVILLPLFEGERIMRCTGCQCIGLGSRIRERSNYRYHPKRTDYYKRCRRCEHKASVIRQQKDHHREASKERARKQRERDSVRRDQDPAYRERQRSAWRKEASRRRATAQGRERSRLSRARYMAKVRQDPERNAQRLEDRRIERRLRDERKGVPLPKPRPIPSHGHPLPIEPLRGWIEERLSNFTPRELADVLGISERTLLRLRKENRTVPEGRAAELLERWGWALDDLYPEDTR